MQPNHIARFKSNMFFTFTTSNLIFSISSSNVLVSLFMQVNHLFNMCNII
jgi:hypothetical protein